MSEPGRGALALFLDVIETVGNRLPDPITLFGGGAVFVLLLSWVGATAGWQVDRPMATPVMTQVVDSGTGDPVTVTPDHGGRAPDRAGDRRRRRSGGRTGAHPGPRRSGAPADRAWQRRGPPGRPAVGRRLQVGDRQPRAELHRLPPPRGGAGGDARHRPGREDGADRRRPQGVDPDHPPGPADPGDGVRGDPVEPGGGRRLRRAPPHRRGPVQGGGAEPPGRDGGGVRRGSRPGSPPTW